MPESNPSRASSPPLQAHLLAGGDERVGEVGIGNIVGGDATNGCASEWCFQNSMDEPSLLNVPTAPVANRDASTIYPNPTAEASRKRSYGVHKDEGEAEIMLDPEAYNAMLRRKLDEDLAAVAKLRTTQEVSQLSSQDNRASRNPNGSIQVSENHTEDVSAHQLSSSSWDPPPPDDDMEQEAENIGTINTIAEKVKMRKESNRDSARRSRSRKVARIKELEGQVPVLRVANNSLMRHLADVSHRYVNITIDNRVLKANVETLEAKVKLAEEDMKRITCTINFPQVISAIASLGIPLSRSSLDVVHDTPLASQNTSDRSFRLQ